MVCSRRRRRGIIRAPETDCGTEETVMLETWNSGDTLTIRVFGKETEVSVFSLGDSRFDENGDYREEGFPLNREELDCLNWFLENVNISDCRREIAAYCNAMYTGTGRPPPSKNQTWSRKSRSPVLPWGPAGLRRAKTGPWPIPRSPSWASVSALRSTASASAFGIRNFWASMPRTGCCNGQGGSPHADCCRPPPRAAPDPGAG